MAQRIQIRLLSAGTVFKLLFIGALFSHVLVVSGAIALAALGVLPAESEGENLSRGATVAVLVGYLVLGVALVPLLTSALWLSVWPGLWVYSRFFSLSLRGSAAER